MFISFECFLVCNESFKTKIIVFIVNSSALDKNSDMKFTKFSEINSKFTNLENELEIQQENLENRLIIVNIFNAF